MKRLLSSFLCAIFILTAFFGCSAGSSAKGAVIFVAANGSDMNAGTKSKPLATLTGARDKIRKMRDTSGLPAGGVTVYIRGGTYQISETVNFDSSDSGTAAAPVRYTAYSKEIPIFTGGSYISGGDFMPVSDKSMLTRLNGDVRENVLCYDLYANGFTVDDLDCSKDFWQNGNLREFESEKYWANGYVVPRMQVFVDDDELYPARYPNKTEGIFTENPYNQYLMLQEVIESGFDAVTEEDNGKKCAFRTYDERIKNWQSYDDIIIFGMMGWEFFQSEVVAEKIDPDTMTITLRTNPTAGVSERGRYAFANVFEELDTPGEYYIDKKTGILYIFPAKDIRNSQVKISRFDESFMIISEDASFLSFSGLTFELTKASVMYITGGESCAVENCTFKNYGTHGLQAGDAVVASRDLTAVYGTDDFAEYLDYISAADNGLNYRISGCNFINTGRCAAILNSGNTGYREKGGLIFEKNLIKHSGNIGSCYLSGIVLNGCGITVKNNSFMFCQGQAINGNVVDTDIVYNEFCDSPCDMAEDTCTIYLNYSCINDGVKIRYNYFHDVTNRGHHNYGFDYARRAVAGYDNAEPFRDFSYNSVYNVPCIYSNPMSPLGPSTTLNNVFVDCDYVLDYPDEYIRDTYNGETGLEIIKSLNTLPLYYNNGIYKSQLWQLKYPQLFEFYEYMANEKKDLRILMSQVCNNLIVYNDKVMSGRATELPDKVEADPKYGKIENNHFLYKDPGFANISKYDFQLSKGAAKKLGIEWLDMSKIGALKVYKPERILDRYNDPLRDVPSTKYINVEIKNAEKLVMASLWRLISPGVWIWQSDQAVVGDECVGFTVKPNGTYTVYFHGDKNYYPQFMGGLTGETPPDGVETFTVSPDRDRFDPYEFTLKKR